MTKLFGTLALGSLLTMLPAGRVAAQNPPAPPPPPMTVDKVADDLFVIRGEGGNITVYVTNDGVVLVDDKFERNYDELVNEFRRRLIAGALRHSRGNKAKAAAILGIKRNRLDYQIRELGIDVKRPTEPGE